MIYVMGKRKVQQSKEHWGGKIKISRLGFTEKVAQD